MCASIRSESYFTFCLPLSFIIIMVLFTSHELHALSPSVPFHEYRDEPLDWIDGYNNFTRVITGPPSTDIFAANYFSDGKVLNATLWLTSPFKYNTTSDWGKINYGMFIDADTNQNTGLNGVDYQIEVSGQNGTWTKHIWQYWSLEGYNRTIYEREIKDAFFGKNEEDKYILLSADLKSIGFPARYKILFYGEQFKEGTIWKTDYSNWILIPPPDFDITILPDNLELKQGDTRNIELQVRSLQNTETVVRPYAQDRENFVQIEFEPNSTDHIIPPDGMKAIQLKISVPEDASAGQYTTQIFTSGAFPPEPIVNTNILSNGSQFPSFVSNENVTKASTLTMTIEPRNLIDDALEELNKWQFPITFVSGIAIGQVGPWIFKKLRKKA